MMRAWWQAQSERDRRTLAVGAFAVALLLGWALVWHPLALRRDALEQEVASRRDDLATVERGTAQIAQQHRVGQRARAIVPASRCSRSRMRPRARRDSARRSGTSNRPARATSRSASKARTSTRSRNGWKRWLAAMASRRRNSPPIAPTAPASSTRA
jgi:type II secretory pathway component PulM